MWIHRSPPFESASHNLSFAVNKKGFELIGTEEKLIDVLIVGEGENVSCSGLKKVDTGLRQYNKLVFIRLYFVDDISGL